MADIKITGYAELAAPISTDLIEVVSDPGGTSISKKVQIRNLFKGGGQIAFPATAVPSADPNTLDDYEEGSWTPAYASTGCSFTYVSTLGKYVKTGRPIICQMRITTGTSTVGTGNVTITGLPFASDSAALSAGGGGVGRTYLFIGDYPSSWIIGSNSTVINLKYRTAANGGTSDLQGEDLNPASGRNTLYTTIPYLTDS